MANYVNRFIPHYSHLSAPLRQLTHKKRTAFVWTPECQKAVDAIKSALTRPPVLAYFNLNMPTEVVVDASPFGLAAILTQKSSDVIKIISFASKALSPTEQRYSQLEREALAVIWGCQHFHLYIFGKPVIVLTDHQPLVTIFNESTGHRNIRLERWALKLTMYDATLKYIPGAINPADYLSRHPGNQRTTCTATEAAEQHVNFIAMSSVPKALTLVEVESLTQSDQLLQQVMAAVRTGNWKILKGTPYWNCKEQLSIGISHAVLLKKHKLCLPGTLHGRAIALAHEGHLGITKTKQLLRSKVWFPGIDLRVEEAIKHCIPCQAVTRVNTREPVLMTPFPNGPWISISIDFYGLPTGEEAMVLTDDYSRYPELAAMKSTAPKFVCPILDAIFREGIVFKVATFEYRALNGTAPKYLERRLVKRVPNRVGLRQRLDADLMLEVPLTRRARYGDRAFSVAAPRIWNSLPGCVKSCSTLGEFKSELKKHLFSCIYSVDLPNA